MMRKLFFLFLISYFLFFVSPQSTHAHVLKTDGSIGATIHIDPDDDPIIGQNATFYFEFKDTKNAFKPADCDCRVRITEIGKELYTQSLFEQNASPDLTSPSFSYVFAEGGVYTITVIGKPKTPQAFSAFSLNYDIRVDREGAAKSTGESINGNMVRIIVILGIVILFLLLLLTNRKKPQNPTTTLRAIVTLLLIGLVTLLHIGHSSKLLSQSEHTNHSMQREHPCCMAQLATVHPVKYVPPIIIPSRLAIKTVVIPVFLTSDIPHTIRPPPLMTVVE